MKVLHIIAQKPSDTGSGVYISNIVRHIEGLSMRWEGIPPSFRGR